VTDIIAQAPAEGARYRDVMRLSHYNASPGISNYASFGASETA